MAREVSYAQQTIDSPNPFTRFAHRSRYRASLDFADRLLPKGGSLVDFGAGEGTFLDQFSQRRPDARLCAIEPYMQIRFPSILQVTTLGEIAPETMDLLSAFEVLEHLSDDDLESFLCDAKRALKQRGALLVTVPIMYGLALPVKEVSRMILHQRQSDTSFREMIVGTVGRSIERPSDRAPTHKGFDFRWLRERISSHFQLTEQAYSPFDQLPWWVNSQAIFVARPA